MATAKKKPQLENRLVERMVRNEDIFCSLLFDLQNRTLRVIDFRGGNFQSKHNYLERVLMTEGMRKIFTLIERDDISGWQRVGYQREGSIPGYYKRSDAYIMSRIYDEDYDPDEESGEDLGESKKLLTEAKVQAKDLAEVRTSGIKVEQVVESDAVVAIKAEIKRRSSKTKAKTTKKKTTKGKKKGAQRAPLYQFSKDASPLFPQFSREVEFDYFVATNRRTKQSNIIGAEYQDCFGNAKVQVFFSPEKKADQNLARGGLLGAIDGLVEAGAVSVFSLARTDDFEMNVLLASAGFRNTGWMNRQILTDDSAVDLVLWTKKLI